MLLVNVAHGLLALYLLTLLAVPKVQTPLVALTCLLAIIGGQWLKAPPLGRRLREGWAMAVPLVGYAMLFAVQIEMGWLRWRDWDQVLICALGLGVLLSNLPARGPAVHRWLLPAAALGAVGALGLASWQYFQLGIPRPHGHLGAGVVGSGALKYGDLSAVLALFSLQLVLRGPQVWRRVLGGVGFMAGLGAVALTQARGALLGVALALAVLGLLWWLRRRAQSSAGQGGTEAGRNAREGRRPWWRQRQPLRCGRHGMRRSPAWALTGSVPRRSASATRASWPAMRWCSTRDRTTNIWPACRQPASRGSSSSCCSSGHRWWWVAGASCVASRPRRP